MLRRGECQRVDLNAVCVQQRVGLNINSIRAAFERCNGRRNILRPPNFHCIDVKTKRAGSRLNLAHFQHGNGIFDIGQNRQSVKAGDEFAKDFESLGTEIGLLD